AARLVAALGVGAAGGALRVDDLLHAEGSRREQADAARIHVARLADAAPVDGRDVLDPGGETRAALAVAEYHGGLPVVVSAGGVSALAWSEIEERVPARPAHAVDPQFQRALDPRARWRGEEGDRAALGRERLERLAGVTVAEGFA